jgi:uncharacterized protein (DUF362 family)
LDHTIKVAVVRSDRRRGAVAEALSLLAADLKQRVGRDPDPVIIPTLDHPGRRWSCTHRDTLSATVDAVLAAGASSVSIVGGRDAPARTPLNPVHALGYSAELWGRPVRFQAIDPGSEHWNPIRWISPEGEPRMIRAHSLVAGSQCLISLAVARTHEVYRVGLGLTNLTGIVHSDDRGMLDRVRGPGLPPGPGSGLAAALVATGRGLLFRSWLGLRSIGGGFRLTARERRLVESLDQASDCLVALAAFLKPALTVVDGFTAMQGEGPRHGRCVALNTIIAGCEPVAVDAVAASIMGFEPMQIAWLREAHRLRLGTADLSEISILGDPPARSRRMFRRHSSDPLLRIAGHSAIRPAPLPRPHFDRVPAPTPEKAHAYRS